MDSFWAGFEKAAAEGDPSDKKKGSSSRKPYSLAGGILGGAAGQALARAAYGAKGSDAFWTPLAGILAGARLGGLLNEKFYGSQEGSE